MNINWLDTTYWPADFKDMSKHKEYMLCVAKHLLWEICKVCPKDFYLNDLKNENTKLPKMKEDNNNVNSQPDRGIS